MSRNPVSGPASDVANSLGELYGDGYQVPITQVSHLQACNAAGINNTFLFCRPSSIATKFSPEEVVFLPAALAKQSRQGEPLEEFFFSSFPQNSEVCHVQTLKQYEALTTPLRLRDVIKLFISLIKPHKPVKLAAITQWLHEILRLAGI